MIRGSDVSAATETLAMFSVATVFLLLASLVAAAGFAVVAQRRLRQLGMLAAVGATEKHLRLVLLTNGAVVGSLAALMGAIAGLGLWVVFAPTLESAVDHRIDRLSLPWGLIAMAVLLAIAGATAAAWWPGRTVARLPVLLALSGRPPRPRPARHSAIAATGLMAVGIGCLALSERDSPPLIIAGLVATILGSLLLGPMAIRTFSAVAGRFPITPRLALRDLARYQARSGAALAAVTLALGIAATVVVIASAEEAKQASEPPSLSDRQIRAYLGPPEERKFIPVDAPAQLDSLAEGVQRLAAQLDRATLIPLRKAVEPGAGPGVVGTTRFVPTIELATQFTSAEDAKSFRGETQLYVATPAVLEYLRIDPATVDPRTSFLVDRSVVVDELVVPSMTSRRVLAVANVQRIDIGQHLFGAESGRKPPHFITLNGLRRTAESRFRPAGSSSRADH
jgi:putative ABC transport system permease protein